MNYLEAEDVCQYLRSKDIQITRSNKWLNDCIDFFKCNFESANIYGNVQEYVCMQWLLTDLKVVKHSCLPTNCANGNMKLNEKYTVQINWIRDIGQSCYTQLQALQNGNISDCNDNVTAEEEIRQKWEPNPKRVLMMEITDGVTTIKAFEYSPIAKLTETFVPGFKVLLTGPMECRKGILFLKSNNIILLGGEVDHLYETNSKEKLLSRCLNITSNNGTQIREVDNTVSNSLSTHNSVQSNGSQLFNEVEELPDSTTNENFSLLEKRDAVMPVDDDNFLLQLPDEVLECADNSHTGRESQVTNNQQMYTRHQNISTASAFQGSSKVSHNKPLQRSRSKLFPSIEDLENVKWEEESVKNSNDSPSSLAKNVSSISDSLKAASSCSKNDTINMTSSRSNLIKLPNDIELNRSTGRFDDCVISSNSLEKQENSQLKLKLNKIEENLQDIEESVRVKNIHKLDFQQFKNVQVQVDSISKLKIRDGEWYCSAAVLINGERASVTFDNKVLEKLFDKSALEVEVWRVEMTTNPLLKKKINDILKAGQAKLKSLNCPMTVEYPSEECPHVIGILTI